MSLVNLVQVRIDEHLAQESFDLLGSADLEEAVTPDLVGQFRPFAGLLRHAFGGENEVAHPGADGFALDAGHDTGQVDDWMTVS